MSLEQFIQKFGGLTEEYKFYDGTVTLRYDPKEHVYLLVTPTGLEKQDGVTNICHILDKSNALIPWACKMMAQKLLATVPTQHNDFKEWVGRWDGSAIEPITLNELTKLVHEAKSAHKDKLEDAGDVGHAAHGWIEGHIKSCIAHKDDETCYAVDLPRGDDRVTNCTIAALTWMASHNVRWLGTERKIYSRQYKYAGTMDGLCYVDSCNDPKCCPRAFKDRLTIADWKTSNYLYLEFVLQTAAYKQAYEEETGEIIEDIWIIRLGKDDAEFETWHVDEDMAELGWNAFLKALELSRAIGTLEQAIKDIKDERKRVKKEEQAAEKKAALAIKCRNADRYKGVRKPTCNDGNPCQTCIAKYEAVHSTDVEKLLDKN